MHDRRTPYIVRVQPAAYVRPGQHSHNANRLRAPLRTRPEKAGLLRWAQMLLLILGLCGLGYYGYTVADEYVYQSYENWAFDQAIAGHPQVTFGDYVRERTPFGFLAPAKPAESTESARRPAPPLQPRPTNGAVIGRVEIA